MKVTPGYEDLYLSPDDEEVFPPWFHKTGDMFVYQFGRFDTVHAVEATRPQLLSQMVD